jgi:hypothetical protein
LYTLVTWWWPKRAETCSDNKVMIHLTRVVYRRITKYQHFYYTRRMYPYHIKVHMRVFMHCFVFTFQNLQMTLQMQRDINGLAGKQDSSVPFCSYSWRDLRSSSQPADDSSYLEDWSITSQNTHRLTFSAKTNITSTSPKLVSLY